MAITVDSVVAEVVDLYAPKFAVVGMVADGDGSWPSLARPLAWAAGRLLRVEFEGPVTDDDLAEIADFDTLCDLTAYRALLKVWSRWAKPDGESVESRSVSRAGLLKDITARIAELEKRYAGIIGLPSAVDPFVISSPTNPRLEWRDWLGYGYGEDDDDLGRWPYRP